MKKGISLIVLVITIIVMIILAASVVVSLSNTGIIEKANTAVQLTDERQVQDLAGLVWAECYLDPVKKADIVNSVKTELANQGVTEDKWNIQVSDTGVVVTSKTNESEEDEYGYLSGTWILSEELTTLTEDVAENVEFSVLCNDGRERVFVSILISKHVPNSMWFSMELAYILSEEDGGSNDAWSGVYYRIDTGWSNEEVRTITFTSKQQVTDEFYDWFTANATKVS